MVARAVTVPSVDGNGTDELQRGRDALRRGEWEEACVALEVAADRGQLGSEDLDLLAECAFYTGRTDLCARILCSQHAEHDGSGRVQAAAMTAYRLHMLFALKGESALAAGWLARARRAVAELPDCVESGYISAAEAEVAYWSGATADSLLAARRVRVLGLQHGVRDLSVLALHLEGRALVRRDDVPGGLRLLDEAMAATVAGELTPFYAMWVYCSSIIICHAREDVRRAAEYTTAYERWSDAHASARVFSGTCHLHRAEIKQLRGAWPEAEREHRQALQLLRGLVEMDAAQASYHLAELHRLRGDLEAAESALGEVGRLGGDVQPALSLLRLAQGRSEAAAAGIRRALAEPVRDRVARARLLPAAVDIVLTGGDLPTARALADELTAAATSLGTSALHARAAFGDGAVRLAGGDGAGALESLRAAEALWRELEVPYERARSRHLIGLACRAAGDDDTAALDLAAARSVFADLGALADLAAVERAIGRAEGAVPRQPGPLTAREVEVLRLVAAGRTNAAVARELHLSEKTVARHLSNVFTKAGVGSRAAATAFAMRNGLL